MDKGYSLHGRYFWLGYHSKSHLHLLGAASVLVAEKKNPKLPAFHIQQFGQGAQLHDSSQIPNWSPSLASAQDSTWLDPSFLSRVLYCRTPPKHVSKDQYGGLFISTIVRKWQARSDYSTMMSAKLHSLLQKKKWVPGPGEQRGEHRETLTWVQSHSQAVASPTTNVDRLEEVEVSGLPSGPQEPWSSDEDGFLRLASVRTEEVITIIKTQERKGGAE